MGSVDESALQRGVQSKAKKQLDPDKAAIIIQKQIRGSIVRKQYGPMVKAATGKLDEETAVFMKSWCKRWRLKSIFQVLLLYRATRQQDLVYFSQQAHLYNQNGLSQIQDLNEEEVDMARVDPKLRASYLPPVRPSVHKIPFRLGDLPYFDTTYMSDPTQSMGKKARDPEETWDAPLQRNIGEKYKRSAGLRNFREQGCQTNVDKIECNRFAPVSGSSLPETPYIRDYTKGVKLPAVDERREFKGKGQTDFGRSQVYRGGASSKQKTSTPPPPPASIVKATKPAYGPIHEMQDKFRSSGDEDEPPFNFQGMLRKTNITRESLKRSDQGFITPTRDFYNNNCNNNNNNNGASRTISTAHDNVVFMSDKIPRGTSPSIRTERNGNMSPMSPMKSINELELAPGLIVHGECSDL